MLTNMRHDLYSPITMIDEHFTSHYGANEPVEIWFKIKEKLAFGTITACPYPMSKRSKFIQRCDFVEYETSEGNQRRCHGGLALMIYKAIGRKQHDAKGETRILVNRGIRNYGGTQSMIFGKYNKCFESEEPHRAILDDVPIESVIRRRDVVIYRAKPTPNWSEDDKCIAFQVVASQSEYNAPWEL